MSSLLYARHLVEPGSTQQTFFLAGVGVKDPESPSSARGPMRWHRVRVQSVGNEVRD